MSRPGSGEKQCSICRLRERAQVDLALARGVSAYALSRRFNVSTDALYRHAKRHLTAQLRASLLAGPSIEGVDLDRLKHTESQSLLANLIAIRHRLFATLDTAEAAGDGNMISRIVGRLHENLGLCGRLVGDLNVGSTTINHVTLIPAYVAMRVELVAALADHPAAKIAVAAVLAKLENDSAQVIENEDRTLATGSVP